MLASDTSPVEKIPERLCYFDQILWRHRHRIPPERTNEIGAYRLAHIKGGRFFSRRHHKPKARLAGGQSFRTSPWLWTSCSWWLKSSKPMRCTLGRLPQLLSGRSLLPGKLRSLPSKIRMEVKRGAQSSMSGLILVIWPPWATRHLLWPF